MVTRKEKAEIYAIKDEIREKEISLEEFEKTDSEEARYRADVLKNAIRKLREKMNKRMHELLREK